jgi:hypothetical protein
MPTPVILYLVSHASGEMVEMLARNAVAQLEDVEVERTLWKMVRSMGQLTKALAVIATKPGFVLHSIADAELRSALEEGCYHLRVPCLFVLEPFVSNLAAHFAAPIRFRANPRDQMDEDYYRRVEAMKFTLAHDDGVAADDLDDADVIVVGVSRSTKTPTCMYLASLGVKAANVPLVPDVALPDGVTDAKGQLVVGLTVDPSRLAHVRQTRLAALGGDRSGDYADLDRINDEVRAARRLFLRRGWPIIDVTHNSVEQTASLILDLLRKAGRVSVSDA